MSKLLKVLKKEWMKKPSIQAEYARLSLEFAIAKKLIKARVEKGYTQEQVAKKAHTTQSAIARMEAGTRVPSMRSLEKYAKAVGGRLDINIVN
jgi:DNA-binding XRE family transcriptional regulator